jgi:tetratricopeptide (TPR) repeat protein
MSAKFKEIVGAADQAHQSGRLDEADRLLRLALDIEPNDLTVLLNLGIVSFKKVDLESAVVALQKALNIEPSSFESSFWMSMALRRQRRLPEALECARRASEQRPDDVDAQNQLGMCAMDLGRFEEAEPAFRKACEHGPAIGPLFDNLGRSLQGLGRIDDAIAAFRRSIDLGSTGTGALFRLGDAYMQSPNPEAAAECARAILKMNPNSVPGNLLLARALIGSGRVEEGAQYALRAKQLAPANAVPTAYYGRALQSLGKMVEADEQFIRSIDIEPKQGFAYYSLVHNHKVKESDRPLVEKMSELVQDGELPLRETLQLEYGLGKAFEDLGDYRKAMSHLDAANILDTRLKVGVSPFDKKDLENTANFLIQTYTPNLIGRLAHLGSRTDFPIFVVGMMRSGTTLAEQILSCHPTVGGAGEQRFWPDQVGSSDKLFKFDSTGLSFDESRLKSLSSAYLELLEGLYPDKRHVVDKMNTNYLLLGLLHIAFPNARIVHMQRHPVDTCLSIWATPVANGINLCASKENVVFAYEQYLRVMDHWKSTLPSDRLLTVHYEELVSDQERKTREMVEFCGLHWSEACLRPDKNQRAVMTPSVWQVRQPIYKTSMQRWRKYQPFLGPFASLLSEDERVCLPNS